MGLVQQKKRFSKMASHSCTRITIRRENQNFYRLIRLLVTSGTPILCLIMEQKATDTHKKATFQEVLDDLDVKKTLEDLYPSDPKKKKVINASQWILLYPGTGNSDTSKYDISLLMILIRNLCGFPKRFNWDSLPSSGDKSLEADIARLKYLRNEICSHSATGSIEDKDFHQYFDETKKGILGICRHLQPHQQLVAEDIEKLRTERTTDPSLWESYEDLGNRWASDEVDIKEKIQAIEGILQDTLAATKRTEMSIAAWPTKITQNERRSRENYKDNFVGKLKDFYSTTMSQLQILDENDWVPMDDIHVTVSLSLQKNLSSSGEKRELRNYLDMFDIPRSSDKNLPRRILIEGTVGMGKSVLSQKMCVDWTRGSYEALKRFQIVLCICLAEVKEHASLQEVIFSQIRDEVNDDTKNGIMSYIQEHQKEILLMLDGYDEYSNKNQEINAILSRSTLQDCCVIITSRPWKTADEKSMKQFDLFLELEGFKHESSIREFTDKFMRLQSKAEESEQLTDRFVTQLKKQNLLSFVQAPFLLIISCLLFLKNRCNIPDKVTVTYQELMNMMLDRLYERNMNQDTDRHAILFSLGKLSYETLVSDSLLLFKKGQIREMYGDNIFDTGLLSQHKYQSRKGLYMVSFPHKSIPEYLAAYFLQHEKDELYRFTKSHISSLESALKYENVLRFTCGLIQDRCYQCVLKKLIKIVNSCHKNYHSKANFRYTSMPEHTDNTKKATLYFCTLLFECAREGNHTWMSDTLNVSFLLLNEETYNMIPPRVKLCVETIFMSGLNSLQSSSIYKRLDKTKLDTLVIENATSLKEFLSLTQHEKRPRVVEIRKSILSVHDIENLKYSSEVLRISDLELAHNSATSLAENTASWNTIRELFITQSSSSLMKYFLNDPGILKHLTEVGTNGEFMVTILQSKKLKKIKSIVIDNEKIQDPGNYVNMDQLMKLLALNPTITALFLRHSQVAISRLHGEEVAQAQMHSMYEPKTDTNFGHQKVNFIHFDECSFVGDMGKGFQQLEVFYKLAVLQFYLCDIPRTLISLLGKSLSKLKDLEEVYFTFKEERNSKFKYLKDSIDLNTKWTCMNTFAVVDGVTSKGDMETVMRMVGLMPNLERLRISNGTADVISSVEQDTIEHLSEQRIPCPKVSELDISGLKVGRRIDHVFQMVKHLHSTEKLHLLMNDLDDTDASTLLQFLDAISNTTKDDELVLPKLKKIYLYGNSFSFEKKDHFAKRNKLQPLHVYM